MDWTIIRDDGFDLAFDITILAEGDRWDTNRNDKGNWTGGAVGVGALRGSRYGISAASYPTLDIKNITPAQARSLYLADYANRFSFSKLPTLLGIVVFDSAVNNGVGFAVETLQTCVSAKADGSFGPKSLAALHSYVNNDSANVLRLCAEFSRLRLVRMTNLSAWHAEPGWSKRLAYLPYRAIAAMTTTSTIGD